MMHCSSCAWQKSTSWDKATLNIEEIKPVVSAKFTLATIKLHFSENKVDQSLETQINDMAAGHTLLDKQNIRILYNDWID